MNDAMLEKIQALLAKAEHPNTGEAERESFISKAQELMTKHSIDEMLVRASGKRVDDVPTMNKFFVAGPHAKAKVYTLNAIAKANGCRLVVDHTLTNSNLGVYLAGYTSDVTNVKAMFVSMLIIGQNDMLKALKIAKRDAKKRQKNGEWWAKAHGASFAPSFWIGFADTLRIRLVAANQAAETAATVEKGNSVALALVDRNTAVAKFVRDEFGRLGKATGPRVSAADGYRSGGESASRVNLNAGVGAGNRMALSR